ncbi:hypothetical protein CWS01_13540 [Niallia nealsonii]|uniref:Uncharacterized protein n=1 Tax=Niallia nealsonii TaxID=115979 RepID=A0A2N0Z0S8_9BACI|nr:hypothetical protein CWS01_13540 [Niallia nealsonii]
MRDACGINGTGETYAEEGHFPPCGKRASWNGNQPILNLNLSSFPHKFRKKGRTANKKGRRKKTRRHERQGESKIL